MAAGFEYNILFTFHLQESSVTMQLGAGAPLIFQIVKNSILLNKFFTV